MTQQQTAKYTPEFLTGHFLLTTWNEDIQGPFGLQPPPGDWVAFKRSIDDLAAQCGPQESIKVIYAGRHGEGFHNVVGVKYGYDEADKRFPVVDPFLTDLGKEQANQLGQAFKREVERGMPIPEMAFVSPFRRCGQTLEGAWGWYASESGWKNLPVTVVEGLREHMILHSWNRRYHLSQLKEQFPHWNWPADMSEEDTLYPRQAQTGAHENEEQLCARTARAMQDVFEQSEGKTYINITSHQGTSRGIWTALGVPRRALVVGEMNVIIVKVTKA